MRTMICHGFVLCVCVFGQDQGTDPHALARPEVQFNNGGIQLAGSILLPPGEGPFPGIVIVHGSGTSPRANVWTSAYADGLVGRGIAVLHPDKRGSGKSGGNWRTASLVDLADDAISAVELLRKHPKVESSNVGIIGFSQGGHIVPAAAARGEHIAFVAVVSGSVVPMFEQVGDEITLMAEREGLSSDGIATVRRIHELSVKYVQSPSEWDEYSEALRQAKQGPLKGKQAIEGFPSEPDSPAWEFARTVGDYDPMVYWRQVKVPVAFCYGGNDRNVRVRRHAVQ